MILNCSLVNVDSLKYWYVNCLNNYRILSSELLVDQLNLATKAPTEEQTKAYQAKVEKLQAAVAKLQKDGADLAQKFAPATPAAPAAK